MALPDSAKWVTTGTAIILADTTDYADTEGIGSRTDQIDCTDLAAGAARQSTKFDFTANMDAEYVFGAVVDWETTPEIAAGETVNFYMGWSNNGTAATANPAALTGTDSAYSGYSAGSLSASLKQLDFIGSMSMDNVINTDEHQVNTNISIITPKLRYGILVVENAAASAAFHSSMADTCFFFLPRTLQIVD